MNTSIYARSFNRKKKLFFYALVLFSAAAFCILGSSLAAAGQLQSITCKYNLKLKDEKIGEVVMTRSPSKKSEVDLIQIETVTSVKVKGFWGTWALEEKSVVEKNHAGVVSFDHRIIENKEKWHLFGKQFDQALWCSARKVMTKKELDQKEVVDLAAFVAAQTVPYADKAFLVMDLLSGSDDEQGDISVPLDRFDTTATTLPCCLVKLPPQKQTTLRILDTSGLQITTAAVTAGKDQQVTLANTQFYCRSFDVKTKQSRSTYLIAQDCLGTFTVREQGEDENGPFEYMLTEYQKNSKP
nr:hypothetical protein [uncultured Desulfobacter sp.]